MPYRKVVLAQDQFYHVFNRGVASLPIFHSPSDYKRFIKLISYYRFANTPASFSKIMKLPVDEKQLILNLLEKEGSLQVEILAFCLMPNHFHFLLMQLAPEGVKNFMRNIQNSYVKYLNIKYCRVGHLFQSAFKAVRIETDEQLLHISRYIHLNPSTAYLVKAENLIDYPWSSLLSYLDVGVSGHYFVSNEPILSSFKDKDSYKKFILDQVEYQRELTHIKHLTFE